MQVSSVLKKTLKSALNELTAFRVKETQTGQLLGHASFFNRFMQVGLHKVATAVWPLKLARQQQGERLFAARVELGGNPASGFTSP